jgi:hypothetical protein
MRRPLSNMTVTLDCGFKVNVDYDFEPGRRTWEINDPPSLEFCNVEPVDCTMLDLLDQFKTPARIYEQIRDALYERLV